MFRGYNLGPPARERLIGLPGSLGASRSDLSGADQRTEAEQIRKQHYHQLGHHVGRVSLCSGLLSPSCNVETYISTQSTWSACLPSNAV